MTKTGDPGGDEGRSIVSIVLWECLIHGLFTFWWSSVFSSLWNVEIDKGLWWAGLVIFHSTLEYFKYSWFSTILTLASFVFLIISEIILRF